jgi:hypothetical protein
VKAGDLVRTPKCGDIIDCECFFCYHNSRGINKERRNTQQRVGIIVHMDSLSHGMLSLPRVLSGGKVLLLGRGVCEVISERG